MDSDTSVRIVRMMPPRLVTGGRDVTSAATLPGLPPGALVSIAWSLEGASRVAGALLPPGHADAGWLGARVLAGDGVWPATMWPTGPEISLGDTLIELAGRPTRLAVRAPHGDIAGTVDQPCRPDPAGCGIVGRAMGLRRDSRQVRIRAAGRVWWLRASGMFGVRVSRGGTVIYTTKGTLGRFHADADELDISVALLLLSSIPSSTYAPILGF